MLQSAITFHHCFTLSLKLIHSENLFIHLFHQSAGLTCYSLLSPSITVSLWA